MMGFDFLVSLLHQPQNGAPQETTANYQLQGEEDLNPGGSEPPLGLSLPRSTSGMIRFQLPC